MSVYSTKPTTHVCLDSKAAVLRRECRSPQIFGRRSFVESNKSVSSHGGTMFFCRHIVCLTLMRYFPAGIARWSYFLTANKITDRYTLGDLLRDPEIKVRGCQERTLTAAVGINRGPFFPAFLTIGHRGQPVFKRGFNAPGKAQFAHEYVGCDNRVTTSPAQCNKILNYLVAHLKTFPFSVGGLPLVQAGECCQAWWRILWLSSRPARMHTSNLRCHKPRCPSPENKRNRAGGCEQVPHHVTTHRQRRGCGAFRGDANRRQGSCCSPEGARRPQETSDRPETV